MNKYIISGVSPSAGGVGRLIAHLIETTESGEYRVLTRRNDISMKFLAEKKKWLSFLIEPFARLVARFTFLFKTSLIKNSIILFIHPQLTGYPLLFRFLKSRNRVFLYVMDNSFFCIQSYNYNNSIKGECTECLGSLDSCFDICAPFPNLKISKVDNLAYLRELKRYAKNIFFLAQNEKQKEMIALHFGSDCRVEIVGMNTGEFSASEAICREVEMPSYDIVFHGSTIYAKGIDYFVDLAALLPEYSFFIPDLKSNVESYLGRETTSPNLHFIKCDWETGLRDIVTNANLVLVPSLWSAPIEGALIKSILLNGNVAVVRSNFGFSSEIAEDAELIILEQDLIRSSKTISEFFRSERKIRSKQKLWINEFVKFNKSSNLFELINKEAN
jgi:hypothetical protein